MFNEENCLKTQVHGTNFQATVLTESADKVIHLLLHQLVKFHSGSFRKGMLLHVHMPAHMQLYRRVINRKYKSNIRLHFLLHNNLCLIQICVYSHVTIKQVDAIHYKNEFQFISTKLMVRQRTQKCFLVSPV